METPGSAVKQFEEIEQAYRLWRQDLETIGARWEGWSRHIVQEQAVPDDADGPEVEGLRDRHRRILERIEILVPGSLEGVDLSPSVGAIEWHLEPIRAKMESLQRQGLVNRILGGVQRLRASDPATLEPVRALAQTLESVRHAETTSRRIIHRLEVLLSLLEAQDMGREALRSLGSRVIEAGWSQEVLHLALFDWELVAEATDEEPAQVSLGTRIAVDSDVSPPPSIPEPAPLDPVEAPLVHEPSASEEDAHLPEDSILLPLPEDSPEDSDDAAVELPLPPMVPQEVSLAEIDWGPMLDSVFDAGFGSPEDPGETDVSLSLPGATGGGAAEVSSVVQVPSVVIPVASASDLLFPLSPELIDSLAEVPPSGITIWMGAVAGGLDILREHLLEPAIAPVGAGVYGRGFRERLGELNLRTEPGRLVCGAESAWDRGWVEEAWKWTQRMPGHPVKIDFLANPSRVRTLLVPACQEWMDFHGITLRSLRPWSRKVLMAWWERHGGTLPRFEDLWRLTGGWSWALGELVRRAQAAGVSIPAALDAISIEGVDMDARANLLGLSWPSRPAFALAWGDEAEATRAGVLERAADRAVAETELDWELWDRLGWMSSDAAGRALLNPWVEDLQGGWE